MPEPTTPPEEPTPGRPEEQTSDERTGEAGRTRLRSALRRPGRRQLVVAVLLALVGFAAVVQIRANTDDSTYSGLRQQDLIDVLNGLAGTTQRTQAEINRLTRTRDDLLSATDRRQAALDEATKEADDLQVLAGLVPVTGPGLRITIDDGTGTVSLSTFLDLIEQLRTSGAEAIAINGTVRVVASTSFDQGDSGLLVDGTPLTSPYVIDVIGVPATLAGGVDFGFGVTSEIQADGATLSLQKLDSLDITPVAKPTAPQFAQPTG